LTPQNIVFFRGQVLPGIVPAFAFEEGLEYIVAVDELVSEIHEERFGHERRDGSKIGLDGVLAAHEERFFPICISGLRWGEAQGDSGFIRKGNTIC
jgi:hypothetical protein